MSATSKDGLFTVCGSFIGLSAIAIGLRFYARKSQKVPFGLDDWTALVGVAVANLGRFGYDAGSLTPTQEAARAHTDVGLSLAYDFLNLNTLVCAKLSALFMYRRIFAADRHGWFNRVILATVVVIALWYISSDFLSCFQCRTHFSAFWDGSFKEYCDLNPVWALELAITDLILDVWILVLPIPSILNLHATPARKMVIFGVFLLAFVELGASIARVVYFTLYLAPGRQVLYVASLESGTSITVVNLPSIYYLFTSVKPSDVAHSLRSMRSIGSDGSQASRSRGDTDLRKLDHGQAHQEAPEYGNDIDAEAQWSSSKGNPVVDG